MRPRVFIDEPLREGLTVELPDAAQHHARVLRLREGEALVLFDGTGGEWDAVLVGKRAAQLGTRHAIERESPLSVTLVQGVSSGERMDYTVQKAVELGVAAIQPLLTKKGVVRLEGKRAEARYWELFTAEQMASSYAALYQELVARHAAVADCQAIA